MKATTKFLLAILISLASTSVFAQAEAPQEERVLNVTYKPAQTAVQTTAKTVEPQKKNEWGKSKFLHRWSLSGGASTLGIRVELATSINNHMTLRGGFNFIPSSSKFMKHNFSQEIEVNDAAYKAHVSPQNPNFDINLNIKARHSHLLLDFTPSKQGVFHITAGVFVGNAIGSLKAQVIDPASKKDLFTLLKDKQQEAQIEKFKNHEVESFKINLEDDASASGQLLLGQKIKPYVGIGFGRAIPKTGVALKLEAGMLYRKPFIFESKNIEGDVNTFMEKKVDGIIAGMQNADYKDLANFVRPVLKNWYPMLSLQLIIRIKN